MCSKVPYKDFGRALKDMQRINRKSPNRFSLKRAYVCDDCGKWHLTSQELKH